VQAAHKRLVVAEGVSAVFQKFDPIQIILLDEKRDYEAQRDERLKLLGLPPWEIEALTGGAEPGSGTDGLFADLLPRIVEARRAQGRLEQRIALLRHIEALRLYVADHGGKPAATLTDIPVRLPSDPFPGKPFSYKADGPTAHLGGTLPRDDGESPTVAVRYAVTVKK